MFGRPIHAGAALLTALLLVVAGCARKTAARVPPLPSPSARIGSTETGMASWYGPPYHGRASASGGIYDMDELTAAHRTLPFETWVEVTNLSNRKRVEVRITDRGPFVDGRVIDLSRAAAEAIDMVRTGTAQVRVKVIAAPTAAVATRAARYTVQAGAFSDPERAESARVSLNEIYHNARVVKVPGERLLWRVLLGRQMTLESANSLAAKVRHSGRKALVVPDPE